MLLPAEDIDASAVGRSELVDREGGAFLDVNVEPGVPGAAEGLGDGIRGLFVGELAGDGDAVITRVEDAEAGVSTRPSAML